MHGAAVGDHAQTLHDCGFPSFSHSIVAMRGIAAWRKGSNFQPHVHGSSRQCGRGDRLPRRPHNKHFHTSEWGNEAATSIGWTLVWRRATEGEDGKDGKGFLACCKRRSSKDLPRKRRSCGPWRPPFLLRPRHPPRERRSACRQRPMAQRMAVSPGGAPERMCSSRASLRIPFWPSPRSSAK